MISWTPDITLHQAYQPMSDITSSHSYRAYNKIETTVKDPSLSCRNSLAIIAQVIEDWQKAEAKALVRDKIIAAVRSDDFAQAGCLLNETPSVPTPLFNLELSITSNVISRDVLTDEATRIARLLGCLVTYSHCGTRVVVHP